MNTKFTKYPWDEQVKNFEPVGRGLIVSGSNRISVM